MKYRKKPVVIDAEQFHADGWASELSQTFRDSLCFQPHGGEAPHIHAHIHTLEGPHFGNDGDWIIRGVVGEFYFCRADIFDATYELALDVGEQP